MTEEQERLKRCQAGDPQAFRALYEQYVPSAWRTACGILGDKALAEDAVQEAFVRVFRSIGQMDVSRPFGAWLKRIVVNESLRCANWRKRGGYPGGHPGGHSGGYPGGQSGGYPGSRSGGYLRELPEQESPEVTEEIVDAAERARIVAASLSDLPEELRVLVILKYYDDLSDPQIASATDTPVGTVKSRLARARGLLRDSCRRRGIDLTLEEGQPG